MEDPKALLELRFQALRREHALRELLRSQNHVAAIGRIAEGKTKHEVPATTQEQYLDLGAMLSPMFAASATVWSAEVRAAEKELRQRAQQLKVWPWVESNVRGLGPLGLALLVASATHHTGAGIERFPNPSAFWKRMGLAVIDGQRQRKIAGTTPEKVQLALVHGFSPVRRALAFTLSDALLKQNKGVYRKLYDDRKAYELGRLEEGDTARKMIAHRRALRYMVKRLLVHVWCVWTDRPIVLDVAAA